MEQIVAPEDLLTLAEAARRVPFTVLALEARARNNQLTTVLIAGRRLVSVQELKARFGAQYRQPSK